MKKEIRTIEKKACSLCGSQGRLLYENLKDQVFDSPGLWSFRECINPKCKLVWLDPMPTPEDIFIAYQNYYTHDDKPKKEGFFRKLYDSMCDGYLQVGMGYKVGVGSSWKRMLAPFAYLHPAGIDRIRGGVMFLDAPKNEASKLLEVGCGNGRILKRMKNLGWCVDGLDFDPDAVEAAQLQGLNVFVGELEAQSYASHSFDAVYMGHVIEHIYDPKAILLESLRILKSKGDLIILTPNINSWGHKKYKKNWRGLEPPRHIHLFNAMNLTTLLTEVGYSNIKVVSLTQGSNYILSMSELIKLKSETKSQNFDHSNKISKQLGIKLEIWERLISIKDHWAGEELLVTAMK